MTKRQSLKIVPVVLSVIGLALTCQTTKKSSDSPSVQELHVLSGAGLIKPMDELKKAFERDHSVKVVLRYGGSGELLGQLAMKQPGDIFIPGAGKHVEDARKKGWIANGTIRNIVKHIPVIAVAHGNHKQIKKLSDLTNRGVTIALGDPDACAIGRVAESIFKKSNLQGSIRSNVRVRTPTVNQLLLYVTLGQVDAAIIWEDMVSWSKDQEKLDVIEIPWEQNIVKTISTSVTSRSTNRSLALKFNKFIDSDEGHSIWSKWGFEPWEE